MADGATNDLIGYFGYGSLVNRATHRTEIVAAFPARLHGWRRFWRPRPDMPFDEAAATPVSLLTVGREAGAATDGLLVIDRAENLPAVDLREQRYLRRPILPEDLAVGDRALPDGIALYVYEAHDSVPDVSVACPIYQSYLDAVLQGFLVEHGETGLREFVFGTGGFDIPVLADRGGPLYPRAVDLSRAEIDLFDALLAERGVVFLPV